MDYDDNFDDDLSHTNKVEEGPPTTCESREQIPIPKYTDDDINQLVAYVQRMTILYAIDQADWNSICAEVIKKWLLNVNELMLTIFYDNDTLTASLGFPANSVYDITYFLRIPNQIFTIDEFHDDVIFGTIHEDIDGALLTILEKVYAPIFFSVDTFCQGDVGTFCSEVHSFLSFLTELHYKMCGLTVLYIPREGMEMDAEKASCDQGLLKRLEAVATNWITNIGNCLSDREQLIPNELMCPTDEYEFWVYRYEPLRALQLQTKTSDFKHIVEILQKAQSIFVEPLNDLCQKIENELQKTINNIKFLTLLVEPCHDLNNVESVSLIPVHLEKIINLIRIIWTESEAFNTTEIITHLFTYLGNQIITICRDKLNIKKILNGCPRNGIQIANMSVDSCIAFKLIYEKVKNVHMESGDNRFPWDLNNAIIFNQIDTFTQRMHDLINICNAMIVFGRYDETTRISTPLDGQKFQNICQEIERQFKMELKYIRTVSSNILDVHYTDWSKNFERFSTLLKNLEDIVENMILDVFLSVSNVEEAVDALCALYYFSKREKLRPVYLKKTSETWEMFSKEINTTSNNLMEAVNSRPSYFPLYAGRALILNTNLNRINWIKKIFDNAEWMPETTNSFAVLSSYEQMQTNITQKIKEINNNWLDSIETDVSKRLSKTLFCRSVTNPGLLECNIDRSILDLFEEAKHFEILGFGVPVHTNRIYMKCNDIRWTNESVIKVCLDYNKILNSLSDKERLLFKPIIQTGYSKITPGIKHLKWSDEMNVIENFISECLTYTKRVLAFIDLYKNSNLNILHSCETIFNSRMIDLSVDEATSIIELNKSIEKYRKSQMIDLLKLYNDTVDDIVKVYRGFEAHLDSIAEEWMEYITKLDRLIEEALGNLAKNTFTNLYETLHGSGTIEPLPLIKIDLDLMANKLNLSPSINEISKCLIGIFEMVTSSLKQFPRLFDKFKLPKPIEMLDYHRCINLRDDIERLKALVTNEVVYNQTQVAEYLEAWIPFKSLWEIDKDLFMKKYEETRIAAKSYQNNFDRYADIENQVSLQEGTWTVHFVEINANLLKNSIFVHIDDWRERHKETLKNSAYSLITDFYDYITTNSRKILTIPKNLKEMQDSLTLYKNLCEECTDKKLDIAEIKDHFAVLERNDVIVSDDYKLKYMELDEKWRWYLGSLKQADTLLDDCKDSFKDNLLQDTENLDIQAKAILDSFGTLPTSSDVNTSDALESLRQMRSHLQFLYNIESQLRSDLLTFDIRVVPNSNLMKMDQELQILEEVWSIVNQWDEAWKGYKTTSFWKIETEKMEEFSSDLYRHVNRLTKQLKSREWTILESTRKKVDDFRKTLPLLIVLKNPSMRERHWDQVKAMITIDFNHESEEFNLESIIEMKFQKYSDEITDISNAATMELQIEGGIANIKELWSTMTIVVVPSENNVCIIKNVDDCFQALEENLVQISTMKSTRFVEPFAVEADYWEKTLNYMFECLENALIVQRQWMYLENIFQGDDIRSQLPKESKNFIKITSEWADITDSMHKAKTAVAATHYAPPPFLHQKLLQLNDELEAIQRALEIYLESKRQLFPRFYFISNDDLLEILGNAKKPDVVQQHFKSLYDNINKCRLTKTNEKFPKWEALGMLSADGEFVKFIEPVSITGPSEKWLKLIEIAMRAVLKVQLRETSLMLRKMAASRDRWLEKYPGQLCLTSCQMQWTTNCTRSLLVCNYLKNRKPLKKLRRKQNKILQTLSELSRKDLPKQMRLKVNAIITIEIHSRDVIDKMYKLNCQDISHFEWFSQLRFYWDREKDNCSIKQTNTSFWYNYEYTGNSGRLVITPLTDRCYITLTTALHLNRGGSPTGPAGTGKTETVKDLGKALGMWVIVNNCSEGMDYISIGKCFSGLAQTGAWGCFDEFNRINIEVLSVVAQQVLSIAYCCLLI